MNVLKPIADGIKESFVLAANIVIAIVMVVYSFVTRAAQETERG
jgi:hypothetical protein